MASQNAVFIRISPSGTVVDLYASQTHTNHETDWENRLKQIGPLLNYLLTWRLRHYVYGLFGLQGVDGRTALFLLPDFPKDVSTCHFMLSLGFLCPL